MIVMLTALSMLIVMVLMTQAVMVLDGAEGIVNGGGGTA